MNLLFHLLFFNDKYYIYDINSGNIASIKKEIYNCLKDLEEAKNKDIFIKNSFTIKNIIAEANKAGLLVSKQQEYKIPYSKDEILLKYENEVGKLVLGYTQNCNLRCKYCVYTGEFLNNRIHNDIHMEYKTLKDSIDFYFQHSSKIENKVIAIYGGEPLLHKNDLIKAIRYIKDKDHNTLIRIDTNGTLLDDRVFIKYLVDNDISLQISLDGPKDMHDRDRVFIDNSGSYDIIADNLNILFTHYHNWYIKNVVFNITLPTPLNFSKLFDFLDNEPFIKDNNKTIGYLHTYGAKELEDNIKMNKTNDRAQIASIKEQLKELLINNDTESNRFKYLSNLYIDSFIRIHTQRVNPDSQYIFPHAICMPGIERLFISSNGDFHICEKIDDSYTIGSLKYGYNYEKIQSLLDRYVSISNSNCMDCWVKKICGSCFTHLIDKEELSMEKQNYFCDIYKKHFDSMLKYYIEIREKNINAFNYIDEILVKSKT